MVNRTKKFRLSFAALNFGCEAFSVPVPDPGRGWRPALHLLDQRQEVAQEQVSPIISILSARGASITESALL